MATATTPPLDAAPAPRPEDDPLYEVVDGRVVEKPPMGAYEGELATRLVEYLAPFVRGLQLGKVVGEVLFLIDPATGLQRRPDVAYVSGARWPRSRRAPKASAWEVVPNLAVEVVSPTNLAREIPAKAREYFGAGVERVWVLYPDEELVYLYESPTSIRVLQAGDEIDGAPLLPGFRLPVTALFEGDD